MDAVEIEDTYDEIGPGEPLKTTGRSDNAQTSPSVSHLRRQLEGKITPLFAPATNAPNAAKYLAKKSDQPKPSAPKTCEVFEEDEYDLADGPELADDDNPYEFIEPNEPAGESGRDKWAGGLPKSSKPHVKSKSLSSSVMYGEQDNPSEDVQSFSGDERSKRKPSKLKRFFRVLFPFTKRGPKPTGHDQHLNDESERTSDNGNQYSYDNNPPVHVSEEEEENEEEVTKVAAEEEEKSEKQSPPQPPRLPVKQLISIGYVSSIQEKINPIVLPRLTPKATTGNDHLDAEEDTYQEIPLAANHHDDFEGSHDDAALDDFDDNDDYINPDILIRSQTLTTRGSNKYAMSSECTTDPPASQKKANDNSLDRELPSEVVNKIDEQCSHVEEEDLYVNAEPPQPQEAPPPKLPPKAKKWSKPAQEGQPQPNLPQRQAPNLKETKEVAEIPPTEPPRPRIPADSLPVRNQSSKVSLSKPRKLQKTPKQPKQAKLPSSNKSKGPQVHSPLKKSSSRGRDLPSLPQKGSNGQPKDKTIPKPAPIEENYECLEDFTTLSQQSFESTRYLPLPHVPSEPATTMRSSVCEEDFYEGDMQGFAPKKDTPPRTPPPPPSRMREDSRRSPEVESVTQQQQQQKRGSTSSRPLKTQQQPPKQQRQQQQQEQQRESPSSRPSTLKTQQKQPKQLEQQQQKQQGSTPSRPLALKPQQKHQPVPIRPRQKRQGNKKRRQRPKSMPEFTLSSSDESSEPTSNNSTIKRNSPPIPDKPKVKLVVEPAMQVDKVAPEPDGDLMTKPVPANKQTQKLDTGKEGCLKEGKNTDNGTNPIELINVTKTAETTAKDKNRKTQAPSVPPRPAVVPAALGSDRRSTLGASGSMQGTKSRTVPKAAFIRNSVGITKKGAQSKAPPVEHDNDLYMSLEDCY